MADAFHNLALDASRGIERFEKYDEEQFWEQMERYRREFPAEAARTDYRMLFRERLADENKTW